MISYSYTCSIHITFFPFMGTIRKTIFVPVAIIPRQLIVPTIITYRIKLYIVNSENCKDFPNFLVLFAWSRIVKNMKSMAEEKL